MNTLILKSAVRQLLKNKLFTLLNIVGLSIGITSCWMIFKIVNYEYSFEEGIPQLERSYRLISKFGNEGKATYNPGIAKPFHQAIKKEIPGVELVAPVFRDYSISAVTINKGTADQKLIEDFADAAGNVTETTPDYFKLVGYKWLAGSQEKAFATPDNLVLTQKRAALYFPNQPVDQLIGKTIFYNDTIPKTISGVIADLPFNSEFDGTEFALVKDETYPLYVWTNVSGTNRLYIRLEDGVKNTDIQAAIAKIGKKNWIAFQEAQKAENEYKCQIEVMPLKESHFAAHVQDWKGEKTSKTLIYGLVAVAIFLMALACINYVNLSTAQLPARSKDIGVRKTLGSSQGSLVLQIIFESLITIFIALLFSVLLTKLAFHYFQEMIPDKVQSFTSSGSSSLFIAILLAVTTGIAAAYPAWLIKKVQPVNLFRAGKQFQIGKTQINLRKTLIVFQFFIAQFFTVSALIIGQQLSYTLNKEMGFNKNAVVTLDMPYKLVNKFWNKNIDQQKKQTFLNEIKKIKGVSVASVGSLPLTDNYSSSWLHFQNPSGKEKVSSDVYFKDADPNYIEVYDLKLIAGNNLTQSDTTNAYVINESAVKAFGFKSPQEAIGKYIGQGQSNYPIVGVIKDFHAQNFYTEIKPLALRSFSFGSYTFNMKLSGNSSEWKSAIEDIKKVYARFFPEYPTEIKFYDETIASLYQKEQNMAKLINCSTIVAILIGCLGLFGLITLAAFQRSKEIGIRKVLGASIPSIFHLLAKNFVQLILISILIAAPLTWWLSNKWLEDFYYRIDISTTPFLLGAGLSLFAAVFTVSFQAIKAAIQNPVDSLRDE
ncbi:ABC transporter permease [Sphingobacterium detergens]|uniref:ABC-type antimicrobial peptide transport system permease subunit n=1 Tax=Sphingobacterium detergens TaxID=1145106 RepID=A0A420AJ68_SPHD1|nr:ABC transporter permease [Sphingobacterium detergens]RKE44531.1 ABC-type antimicrobial peptide transport system permease subunit [Sphingobacterium detergens]